MPTRCVWAGTDPLYVRYHDVEWGVPQHNDRKLFEMLILEGAQAGLSWITILRKRRPGKYSIGSTPRRSPDTRRSIAADCSPIPASSGIA